MSRYFVQNGGFNPAVVGNLLLMEFIADRCVRHGHDGSVGFGDYTLGEAERYAASGDWIEFATYDGALTYARSAKNATDVLDHAFMVSPAPYVMGDYGVEAW